LKGKIRTTLDLRKFSIGDLAEQTELARSSLEHCLAPKGNPPGRLLAERLERWLAETTTPRDDDPPEPRPAAVLANGHALHTPPGRLSIAQRERLAGYAQLDERTMRRELQMTPDLFNAALAGREVVGEALERITNFLATSA
jgi:hypothetical protein